MPGAVRSARPRAASSIEIRNNYFAISKRTNNVYYFGEERTYENGRWSRRWLSGEKGAKFGLDDARAAPARAKHYQEVAPGAAMDRAEIVSLNETVATPAGEFKKCIKMEETTPLEPGNKGYKYYAPGVGLVRDGSSEARQIWDAGQDTRNEFRLAATHSGAPFAVKRSTRRRG